MLDWINTAQKNDWGWTVERTVMKFHFL